MSGVGFLYPLSLLISRHSPTGDAGDTRQNEQSAGEVEQRAVFLCLVVYSTCNSGDRWWGDTRMSKKSIVFSEKLSFLNQKWSFLWDSFISKGKLHRIVPGMFFKRFWSDFFCNFRHTDFEKLCETSESSEEQTYQLKDFQWMWINPDTWWPDRTHSSDDPAPSTPP